MLKVKLMITIHVLFSVTLLQGHSEMFRSNSSLHGNLHSSVVFQLLKQPCAFLKVSQ